jgi:methyl-accepting chemotaxis protein
VSNSFPRIKGGIARKEELILFLIIITTIVMNGFGLYMILSLPHSGENEVSMYNERLIPLSQLAVLSKLTENTRVAMLTAVNMKDYSQLERAEQNMMEIDSRLKIYAKTYMTEDEQTIYQSFAIDWKRYCELVKKNILVMRSGNLQQAREGLKSAEGPFEQASEELMKIIRLNEQIVARFHSK